MPSEPPNDLEAAPPAAPPAVPVVPAISVVPPEPVSPAKEWAVAVAIMIVFAIIGAQLVSFLRSNPLGGP